MLSKLHTIMAAALVISTVGTEAFAQGSVQQQNACEPDVFRLCGSYIPDVHAIVACLRGNQTGLSEACHEVMFPDDAGRDNHDWTARIRPDRG